MAKSIHRVFFAWILSNAFSAVIISFSSVLDVGVAPSCQRCYPNWGTNHDGRCARIWGFVLFEGSPSRLLNTITGVVGTKAGTLTFLQVRPILELMGSISFTVAHPVQDLSVKICNNLVLSVQQIAVGDAMFLGQNLGLFTLGYDSCDNHRRGWPKPSSSWRGCKRDV